MKKLSIKKLPTSLTESIKAIKSDKEFLKSLFDDDFLEMYIENLIRISK